MTDSPHKVCIEHQALIDRIKAACTKMDLQFKHVEKSIETAKFEMDRRLEGMNEFREQLSQQATHFASRSRMELLNKQVMDKIESLQCELVEIRREMAQRSGSLKWIDHIITVLIGFVVVISIWVITT